MNASSLSRTIRLAVLSLMFVSLAGAVSAQEFALEGKIGAIDTASRTLTVMGTVVSVPAGVAVDTPTGSIDLAALDPASGPSLVNAATAIISGTRTGGVNVAESVFVEIAENVMFGNADSVNTTELVVNGGARIRINTPGSTVGDARFAAVVHPSPNFTVTSETGYPVALPASDGSTTQCVLSNPADPLSPMQPLDSTRACEISAGELISAEGDYRTGTDGVSYLAAHTVEVGKAVLYNPANVPGNKDYVVASGNVTLEGNRLSLRGIGTFAGARVSLFRADANCVAGTALANGNGVQLSAPMSTADGRFRFDKAAVAGSLTFTNVVVRTPNGATACTGVERR